MTRDPFEYVVIAGAIALLPSFIMSMHIEMKKNMKKRDENNERRRKHANLPPQT